VNGWPTVPLRHLIATLDAGVSVNALDSAVAHPDEIGVLKVSCVRDSRFFPAENKKVLSEELTRVAVSPQRGDIVISRANSLDLIGASGLVRADYPNLFLSDKLWRARLAAPDLDSAPWLVALLNSRHLRRELYRRATGTSGSMKNISKRAFLAIRVPRLPRDLQKRLGEVVDSFDSATGGVQQLLQMKRHLRSGLAAQMLTGIIRFPQFRAQPWIRTTIGDVLHEVQRPVPWSDETTYTLVSVKRRSGGVFLRARKAGSEILVKALYEIREGDILISTRQVVHGAIGLVPKEFDGAHVSGEYMVLVPNTNGLILPEFFDYLTRLPRMYHAAYLASYGVAIEKLTFNPDWYFASTISLPPTLDEQRQVAQTLSSLDGEIALLEKYRTKLRLRKSGMVSHFLDRGSAAKG
jgi:type I restriction enzyme, S subunit